MGDEQPTRPGDLIDPSYEVALENEPSYHGLLPREDMQGMLKHAGDYLIRISEPNAGNKRHAILSALYEGGKIHHLIIKHCAGGYSIDLKVFKPTTKDLIEHFKTEPLRVNEKTVEGNRTIRFILKNSVTRQAWELSHDDITIGKKLGEGAFGSVCLGSLRYKGRTVPVAIKQAQIDRLTKEQIKELMSEARLMRKLRHEHVIRMYGVAATKEPLMLVMDVAPDGSLDSYLQKNQNLSVDLRTKMCLHAAWGLEYMHQVAARNFLYGNGRVMIADFGQSREATEYKLNPHKRVPIRWLAPEVIRTQTSTMRSDVFAYGIACWEIFSFGKEPYPDMRVSEVAKKVISGYRMDAPRDMPSRFVDLLRNRIWEDDPTLRPTMAEVSKNLHHLLTGAVRPNFDGNLSYKATLAPDTTNAAATKMVNAVVSVPVQTGAKTATRDRKKRKKGVGEYGTPGLYTRYPRPL